MSNKTTNELVAFFKGRKGVCESVYQHDYGRVMVLDDREYMPDTPGRRCGRAAVFAACCQLQGEKVSFCAGSTYDGIILWGPGPLNPLRLRVSYSHTIQKRTTDSKA